MLPTSDELMQMGKLSDVYAWARLNEEEINELNQKLGGTGDEHPRTIGLVTEAEFEDVVTSLRFGDNPDARNSATVVQKGQLRLVGLVCRSLAAGLAPAASASAGPGPEVQQVLEGVSKLTEALAMKNGGHSVQLKQVVSQGLEETVPKLTREDLGNYYEEFRQVFSRDPGQDEECSVEQLSGLKALLTADVAPYVDFGVWGPNHHRLLRRLRLQGLQLHSDGTLHTVELVGPPDFKFWLRSDRLLLTGLLGFCAVSLGNLLDYAEKIREYSERYGQATWALLYQADVRCRQEHMERVRRTLEHGAAAANAEGKAAAFPFNPKRPWDGVWSAAIKDFVFWRREFGEPALLILSRGSRLQDMVSGEAPVGEDQSKALRTAPQAAEGGAKRKAQAPPPTQPVQKAHKVADGVYTHNRRDQPLCPDFQSGQCQRGQGLFCPRHRGQVHQCNKCLDTRHGGGSCQAAPKAPSSRKGKGKGKGGKQQWQ